MSKLEKFQSEVSRHRQPSDEDGSESEQVKEAKHSAIERSSSSNKAVETWRKHADSTNGPVLRAVAKVVRILACVLPILYLAGTVYNIVQGAIEGQTRVSVSDFFLGLAGSVMSAIILLAAAEALVLFVNIADDTRALKNQREKQD